MPKQIILDQKIVDDEWQHIGDEQTVPPTGNIIVSLANWLSNREALIARDDGVGISINGDDPLNDVVADLEHFDLIALQFPAFTDGRCYSYARLLRERHGYTDELRAIGDVLQEQLFPMYRCGINAFEMREDQNIEEALARFNDFSVKYQAAADEPLPLFRRRAA